MGLEAVGFNGTSLTLDPSDMAAVFDTQSDSYLLSSRLFLQFKDYVQTYLSDTDIFWDEDGERAMCNC